MVKRQVEMVGFVGIPWWFKRTKQKQMKMKMMNQSIVTGIIFKKTEKSFPHIKSYFDKKNRRIF